MNLGNELVSTIEETARQLGRDLSVDLTELRAYSAQRMMHLSTIIDEPGYFEALEAERDNVALKAGIRLVDAADRIDRQLIGIVAGALAVGARALSPVA